MVPFILFIFLVIPVIICPVSALEQWVTSPGFGPAYVSDTIPDTLLPGQSYPVLVTFRNTGLVSWQDEMRRIGLLYEGDMTKVTAIPSFVEISRDLNITPGKHAHFGFTLLPVGVPGSYDLPFSVVMRSATGDQKITEVFVKRVTIVPTGGISSPVNGSVFVESPVLDLDVYLDSVFMGNVPAIIADVKPGQYMIRVGNESFERTYPVDVERGVMTRLLVRGDDPSPVITKKTAGPISDGTLIGYIEANIPLIVIISLILLVCIGVGMYGLRKRNRTEEERKKEEKKKKSDDPDSEKAEKEKDLLDKIHSKKPLFEGLSSTNEPSQYGGNTNISSTSGTGKISGKKPPRVPEKKKYNKESLKSSKPLNKDAIANDVDFQFRDLTTRPGSATASIGVSNHSPVPVSVEDQTISPGGFGIVPVELNEPTNDEPDITLSLRILAEGSEFFKNIIIPYNLGIALLARGVVEKAYEYFRALLVTHPDNIDGLLNQAQILYSWGLEEEALSVLQEILALDPNHEDALNALNHIQKKVTQKKEKSGSYPKSIVPGYPEELSDRYTPIRVLGDDPFATVILVRKNDTGDLRALKIPRTMEKIGTSLFTEISLLYQLRHPYVLRMFRAEFSPVVMLELEFVSGGWYEGKQYMKLSDLPVPLPFDVWSVLIEKIAEGLAYLHRQGVRHYHLSPKYILLDEPLNPKISGLIRESLRSAGVSGVEEFFVCAPEQIDSSFFGKPGKRTDIFQLGAIWLWLVTGQIMGKEESADEKISFIVGNDTSHPSLDLYVPLFKKLTARFKKDRYASVEEFLDDLRGINMVTCQSEEMSSSGDDE